MMAVASANPTFETTLIQRSNILLTEVGKAILSVGNAFLVMGLWNDGCCRCAWCLGLVAIGLYL